MAANGRSQQREDHEVSSLLRAEVLERDGGCCRVCGAHAKYPALHHIEYRSEGGLNVAENLITIGWLWEHDCHLPVVHANKRLWQPILKVVVLHDGLTARGLLRSYRHHQAQEARS